MTQTFNPGMKELGDIVAGLYKDVKLLKECSWLGGAQKYASKHKGWTATQEDILGPRGVPDGVDEILVRDKKGNIRVINGYTLTPSQHSLRQAYYTDTPRWTDEELEKAEIMELARRRARKGRPMTGMKAFKRRLYAYEPEFTADETGNVDFSGRFVLPPDNSLQSGASNYLRKTHKTTPRKLLQQFYKQIWDAVKTQLYIKDKNGNLRAMFEAQTMLAIYAAWFNNEYLNYVVVPTLRKLNINYFDVNSKAQMSQLTNDARFKNEALKILGNMDIRDIGNAIAARLQQLIDDVKSGTPPKAVAQKIYEFVKNETTPINHQEESPFE